MKDSQNLKHFFQSHKLLLAPMAGVTDEVFRGLCIEQGATLTYTEMVSAKGLAYASEKTRRLLSVAENESQVAVQLFGHEPDVLAQVATSIEKTYGARLAYIDINMGCPARKIVSKGDGSALMRDPRLAADIVRALVDVVSCPVTVKFRRGFEMENETAAAFARTLEAAGASALAVHGRFSEQYYKGVACWDTLTRVKEAVSIPVIGNGDVKRGEDAVRLIEQTGCDGVMIGRAACGNPWIFRDARAALANKSIPDAPSALERIAMARRHGRMLAEREGKNIVRMRKHAMWYLHGLSGAAAARGRINSCVSVDDFDALFDELTARVRQASN